MYAGSIPATGTKILYMKIVKTLTAELTLSELHNLLIEKAGLSPDTKVTFKYKDTSDDMDNYPRYVVDGVSLVDIVKWNTDYYGTDIRTKTQKNVLG